MELYAIASAGSGDILWAGLASAESAEQYAVTYAVAAGGVSLLSGEDLALHLLGGLELRRLSPTHALESTWKPGDRVELVRWARRAPDKGGSDTGPRPGTVDRIDREYGYRERLVVAFDDGETAPINPDVMRHRREENA